MNGLNIIALCLLAVVVAGDGEQKRLDDKTMDMLSAKFEKECKEESKVDPEVYTKATKSMMDTKNRPLQCYTSCLMMKFNVMKANGDYDINILYNLLPESRAKPFLEVIKKCNNETDPDPCKRAMNVYECTQKVMGDKFHFH